MEHSLITNAWLCPTPDARPDRQLLVGDPFEVQHQENGWAFGQSKKDGYQGCVPDAAIGPAIKPTHWISHRSVWAYDAPDFKSPLTVDLHIASRVEVVGVTGRWNEIRHGERTCFVPAHQCREWGNWNGDPIEVARQYLKVPYVWAGNTGFGLDCSGLVQAVFHACGWACAADSQDQKDMPGEAPENQAPGDLIFWKDHVAIETGEGTLIHANAHHMCVTEEPRHAALTRIAATETGPVTARLRPARRALV